MDFAIYSKTRAGKRSYMEKALFITNPEVTCGAHPHPWGRRDYNNRAWTLEGAGGISLFRRDFECSGNERVTVDATALGIFELFCNGHRVAADRDAGLFDELCPGWTDYKKTVFFYSYDITDYCVPGRNVICALVSPGWWSGRISFGWYGFRPTAFAAKLTVGGRVIYTGTDWKTSKCTQVRFADIWDGELFDSRLPSPCDVGEDMFIPAALYDFPVPAVVQRKGPPIREKKELQRSPMHTTVYSGSLPDGSEFGKINVVSMYDGEPGEIKLSKGSSVIFDMGVNMVGVPEIEVCAPSGTRITGIFSEMLNDSGDPSRGCDGPQGSPYIKNYRTAVARMIYISCGRGDECYRPHHTFYGFRYFELSADGDIVIKSVRGRVIGSLMKETSGFSCSDEMVNRFYQNTLWGMRGNYLSVPTDCPQRDERLGWTGDAQIFSGAASYLADISGFMEKWLADARDSQQKDGGFTEVIPRVFGDCGGDAAWSDAPVIIPDRLFLMYGKKITREHFDACEKYMDFLHRIGGPRPTYGDWLCYENTDPAFICLCYYAIDALFMAEYARSLAGRGRVRTCERRKNDNSCPDGVRSADFYSARAAYYDGVWSGLKEKFFRLFIKQENGEQKLGFSSQTACLLALRAGFADKELAVKIKEVLRDNITGAGYRLSTGFVGTGLLLTTLDDAGMEDLCYDLLLQTKEPSWLGCVLAGATTVWERWNSYTLDKGFGDVGMNSFNHYAYGAAVEWLFSGMLGIKPQRLYPGFARFTLSPKPDTRKYIPDGQERISRASGYLDTLHGRIYSGWEITESSFEWQAEIPKGTCADAVIPALSGTVYINGEKKDADSFAKNERGDFLTTLMPGIYRIEVRL